MSKKFPFRGLCNKYIWNGSKPCLKLNDSTFTIFIEHCEENSGWKSLSEWYAKSYDCFLTHWLPMTSVPFLTEVVYCKNLRCNYVRIEKYFLNFFLHFLNLNSILNIFKKSLTLMADVFFNLRTPEDVVR